MLPVFGEPRDGGGYESVALQIDDQCAVSGLWTLPERAPACVVLAHGAGAGMTHPFMADFADGLAARGVASLRYQFPYMEQGSKRPDRAALAHATVRAAVGWAARRAPELPLFAGGKSFGGRMTSQAQALSPLPGVRGLVFLGFPLHPAKQPSVARAEHLAAVRLPMLFLQGSRDALADLPLLKPAVAALGRPATLVVVDDADHSFCVPARSGRTQRHVRDQLLDATRAWIDAIAGRPDDAR